MHRDRGTRRITVEVRHIPPGPPRSTHRRVFSLCLSSCVLSHTHVAYTPSRAYTDDLNASDDPRLRPGLRQNPEPWLAIALSAPSQALSQPHITPSTPVTQSSAPAPATPLLKYSSARLPGYQQGPFSKGDTQNVKRESDMRDGSERGEWQTM